MNTLSSISGRPAQVTSLCLAMAPAPIAAIEFAIAGTRSGGRWIGLVTSVTVGGLALIRERNRAWAVTGGLTICAIAAAAARRDERLELARELHDAVAHQLAAIVIQSQAARVAVARRSPPLPATLAEIESAGGEALIAMRRVTQEALTNIVRHAPEARDVRVAVHQDAAGLRIEVTDDGPGRLPVSPWSSPAGGYGLIGTPERVEALGGRLQAGPHPNGGWTVLATVPHAGCPS